MIALGCDHGGFALMQEIIGHLDTMQIPYKNFGCGKNEAVDYPVYAKLVGQAVVSGECDKGILVCTTGVGISIAANKIKGIRAALCADCFTAAATRAHNDSNVLCLGGGVVGPGLALKIVETYLSTAFSEGERHKNRIRQIE